ncbi:MAG: hypothetical protein HY841_04000 [Bacteroidetes bacterium]|nr:hypothetical protein [Bacteroidota bacterium]
MRTKIARPLCLNQDKNRFRRKQKMEVKTNHPTNTDSSSIFLTGAILFANLDYSGLAEYAMKAAVGGIIWMVFKLTTDFISGRIKRK